MKRNVKVLKRLPENNGELTVIFDWETSKKGMTSDVLSYLIQKFQTPALFPAGYHHSPLEQGDQLQLTPLEGSMIGRPATFEMATPYSYRHL